MEVKLFVVTFNLNCTQFMSENRMNECQIFGLFGF